MSSRLELQEILEGIDGIEAVYFQPPQNIKLQYPCIVYERDRSFTLKADNILYLLKKRYSVIVIDRNPDSLIPEQVEALQHCSYDRFYVSDGLNHHAFQLFF